MYSNPRPIVIAMFASAPAGSLLARTTVSDTFQGKWNERDWRCVPGAFYTAGTDTCEMGVWSAPENILQDRASQEYVFRQPQMPGHLSQMVEAAIMDPYQAYAIDGNAHWTVDAVEAFWRERYAVIFDMEETLAWSTPQASPFHSHLRTILARARDYFRETLEQDLAEYSEQLKRGWDQDE